MSRNKFTYGKYELRPKDKHIEAIYQEIATELGFSEGTVREAVNNLMSWQHRSFAKAEYAEYYWPRFGVFYYFNMEGRGTYYPEVDEFKEMKKIKDKNRYIDTIEDSEVPEDILTLIDKITSYDVSLTRDSLLKSEVAGQIRKFGWYIGGNVNEGSWNVDTMKVTPKEELEYLLGVLQDISKED